MEFIFNFGGTPGFYTHNDLTHANFMRRARWLASVGYATKNRQKRFETTRPRKVWQRKQPFHSLTRCEWIFQQLILPVVRESATRAMINSDMPVLFRPQVQALDGQLSYSDRHMVLPVETSGRLGMG